MKKMSYYISLIIFCVASASIPFFIKADIFEDLFKNIDFEQLAKDMEKVLGNTEDSKDDLPQMPPVPAKSLPDTTTSGGEKISTTHTESQKDMRTLFLDPDIQTIQDKNKSITTPTKKSRAAFSHFKQELEKCLTLFEKNIQANSILSPQFKDKYLHEIRKRIDEIVIASELIDSKKVYQKIFLTPPAGSIPQKNENEMQAMHKRPIPGIHDSMKQLRQRYLSLINDLNLINKKIEVTEEKETKEVDKELLEKLAEQKQELLPEYTHLAPIKPKVRGAKQSMPAKKLKIGSKK